MSLNAWMSQVYDELGLESHSLPDAGTSYQLAFIDDRPVIAWVIPKASSFKLRIYCQCPDCSKVLPVGRLQQHSRMMHS